MGFTPATATYYLNCLSHFKKICIQSFNRPHCSPSITLAYVSEFLKILYKEHPCFYKYIYYTVTSFGPKLGPSSGCNNTKSKYIQKLETIKQVVSPFTSRDIKKRMPKM